MNFEMKIYFEINQKDDDYLNKFFENLINLLKEPHKDLDGKTYQFLSIIDEILKNICDHAGGQGKIFFKKTENIIEFEISDFINKPFDWEKYSQEDFTTKPESENNYGMGLWHIENNSHILEKLIIDTSSGFKYSGIFKIPT